MEFECHAVHSLVYVANITVKATLSELRKKIWNELAHSDFIFLWQPALVTN